MSSNEILPEHGKGKQVRACPYLGVIEDSQTTLSFPSGSNFCHHAKPLASPNLEYQRLVCLKGRRHTLCPVFTRSEIAPLPPDISGSQANPLLLGMPIEKRVVLPILLGCVVLILGIIGSLCLLNNQGGRNPGKPVPTSSVLPLAPATISITDIPITPNVEPSGMPNTDTPVGISGGTLTPQLPPMIGITTIPTQTKASCGSPNTWVDYIVRPGDSLYHLSLVYSVTVAELQRANCLGTSSLLHTGQLLHVPSTATLASSPTLPVVVIPTYTPTNTPVLIPPSDTATAPPVETATEIPSPTDVPTDTPTSPG